MARDDDMMIVVYQREPFSVGVPVVVVMPVASQQVHGRNSFPKAAFISSTFREGHKDTT